jgi:hypothetical protein
MVEVRDIFADDAVKMSFTQNEDMIQAFAPHTANEPLADRISLWCFHRGLEHLNLMVPGYSGEAPPILVVMVSDQKAGSLRRESGFPDLLGDPNITR